MTIFLNLHRVEDYNKDLTSRNQRDTVLINYNILYIIRIFCRINKYAYVYCFIT